jgi:hypothetical protein
MMEQNTQGSLNRAKNRGKCNTIYSHTTKEHREVSSLLGNWKTIKYLINTKGSITTIYRHQPIIDEQKT